MACLSDFTGVRIHDAINYGSTIVEDAMHIGTDTVTVHKRRKQRSYISYCPCEFPAHLTVAH